MNGNRPTKKAGNYTHKRTVFMLVNILAVTIFIGTALQPAFAAPITKEQSGSLPNQDNTVYCNCIESTDTDAGCKMCIEAAFHAVKYMRNYVKQTIQGKGLYFLWTADVAIVVFEGLALGLIDSGFQIEIDYDKLHDTITFWTGKLWGPQMFFVTRFMARLAAISIGITWYLLSLCIDTSTII
jgi:hypothetical protein